MAKTTSFWLILVLCCLMINTNISDETTFKPTEVTKAVDYICKKASSYSFCVNSLYTDSRTPDADEYTLSFIAVGLAYNNATDTQAFISELLKNESCKEQRLRLERCSNDYNTTADAFAKAFNDLDSETFYYLEDYAADATDAAKDSESAFKGIPSPLSSRNSDIVGLSEIVAIIGKIFTGGDYNVKNNR